MGTDDQERRRLKRHVRRIPARFESEGLRGQGHIKNLHKQGMFVRCSLLPRPGAHVQVSFEGPDGLKVEVEGTVRWTTEQLRDEPGPPGFGIQLVRVGEEYLCFFESVLCTSYS